MQQPQTVERRAASRPPRMPWSARRAAPYAVAGVFALALAWSVSFGSLPPADFTFINGTEIKSVDPAIVTGAPEGRIISAIYEPLLGWAPDDLHPIPGVADRPEKSADGLRYTFQIRPEATWCKQGIPVRAITAEDFVYSFRRLLHPTTAAEYAYQLFYLRGAEAYTTKQFDVGDAAEVEFFPPKGAPEGVSGEVVAGKVVSIENANERKDRVVTVEIGGEQRKFSESGAAGEGVEHARTITTDFRTVGVRAEGERTLVLELNHATPYFENLLGFYPLSPVNRECIEEHGFPDWTKPENIITNGPFYLKFHRLRDRIRLVKNPGYWNASSVKLNTVDALAVNSDTTGLNLYLTGEVDWLTTVPASAVPQLKLRDDFRPSAMLTIYFYRINTLKPGLNDPRVRRALSLALDREEITERVTRAGEAPAYSFVPPGVKGYESPVLGPRDTEAAKKLLAEAGYPDGKGLPSIEILYNTLESHKDIAEAIKSQWERTLGVTVRVRNLEWQSHLAETRAMKYSIARAGWVGDYVDPNTFLDMFQSTNANNQTGWGNATYDKLISDAAAEPDPERRFKLLHDAEAILLENMPVIPIYFTVAKNMVRPYVHGFHDNLQDVHPLEAISIDERARNAMKERRADP